MHARSAAIALNTCMHAAYVTTPGVLCIVQTAALLLLLLARGAESCTVVQLAVSECA
jgi:hypothetical protein